MTEEGFSVLLLVLCFFSLAGLHQYSISQEPVKATIAELLEHPSEFKHSRVELLVSIDSYHAKREGLTFLELSDNTASIKAVHFGSIEFSKGSFIRLSGRVQEYKGELEFIVEGLR